MTALRRRRFSALAAAAAAIVLATSGCAAFDESSDVETLRMGTQPWLGYGQWYVAEEQGYFTDRGVEVELSSFNADADVNAALASGKLDMANVGAQAALQFIEQGVDVSIVMLLDSATDADAILGSGIDSVEGLRGKSVAFEEGATSEILLAEALDNAGMTFDDIDVKNTSADQVAAMLLSGNVDAGVTYEPYVSEALANGDSIETVATAGEYPGLITDVLVVRNEVLDERPEAVRSALRAWDDAVAFYAEDPETARAVIADGVGSDPQDLQTAFDGVHFYSLAENEDMLTGEYLSETLPALVKVSERIGLVSGEIDAKAAVRSEFLTD